MTLPSLPEEYGEYLETEVAVSQPLSDYTPRSIADEISFSESGTTVVVTLTAEQYRKIISSLFTGAWWVYPGEWLEVLASFWQGVKVIDCSFVADCIETSSETQSALADVIVNNTVINNALADYLTTNGYGAGAGNGAAPTVYNDNPAVIDADAFGQCDNDRMFGAVTQTVDLLNEILVDAFEGFEAATARTERISAILEGIPIVGELPFDDIIQLADQMLENLAQNYDAQYTAQLRDEYRCDLFCLVRDTCELDFQVFADYFFERAGATLDDVTILEALDWFTFGTFNGDLIVHAAHAILCQFLAYGSQFFNVNMTWFTKACTSFLNDPDEDWETLCECGTYDAYYQQFNLSGMGLWTIGNDWGTLTADGVESVWNPNLEQAVIDIQYTSAWSLDRFEITIEKEASSGQYDRLRLVGFTTVNPNTGTTTELTYYFQDHDEIDAGTYTICFDNLPNVASRHIWRIYVEDGTEGNKTKIKDIKIWSTDDLPEDITHNSDKGCGA